MESEKVKEIKTALKCMSGLCKDNRTFTCYSCVISQNFTEERACKEALTLINELESENKRIQSERIKQAYAMRQKEDRIAELEKEKVCSHCKRIILGKEVYCLDCLNKFREIALKSFAERLKEYIEHHHGNYGDLSDSECNYVIDETLKEFVKGKGK